MLSPPPSFSALPAPLMPTTPASSSSSRTPTQHCRVVEKNLVSEDELGMQIGKQGYPSMDEANIDLKVVCDNS